MATEKRKRAFVRSFFTSPTAVEEDDTAKMLRKASQLRGMQAPDVWVPDNEDATAPSMRDEGVENILDVISEHGEAFPGEIHPRVVWHRDDPETRRRGFEHMMRLADPDEGAIQHIDGFVVPEVGAIDDWKKADEFITIVESKHGLEEGSLSMSPIIESGEAELAMSRIDEEIGKRSNNLERLFLLVDGEVDYTKDMRAMTPTGDLPPWPELRHNTSRAASANGLIAVDGPYDDIRDVEGYHERMTDNRAKGMLGIWSLTPGQVVEANTAPLPPEVGTYLLDVDGKTVELERTDDDAHAYDGDDVELEALGDGRYRLKTGGEKRELDEDELRKELRDRTQYVMAMDDYVDSMEEFEEAKAAGKGAISMTRTAKLVFDDTEVEVTRDRMWDEATYQAAQTPITLFQEVYEARPDQRDDLRDTYGEEVVDRAMEVG
ncbi:malate synthase AceB [Haladaptatus halobius]|uniref:malate synthase AceB n=1 Tax=Haladaptatus halobius TaxID=2884875 RepID=UPI001D0B9AC1|nr:malate synthase AceB [Haladaptatus halobius]